MPEIVKIVTEAQTSTGTARAHEFPALEAGNIAFPKGRYIVDFEPRQNQVSFGISHKIEGAPLISDLITGGFVNFVCAVASPVSSYRKTHYSESPSHIVRWDEGDLGEPPLFTPMVVAVNSFRRTLDQARDGVHALWHGRDVQFTTGMRLVVGTVVQLRSSVLHMLSFHQDPSLNAGEFRVKAETQEGFRFRVELATELHTFLRVATEDPARAHILTHIVSACFALLKSDFADDDDDDGGWRSYRSLRALSDHLNSMNLPHWSDGKEFIPELTATRLYPYRLSSVLD